jgi:hypothetical protein
MNRARIFFGLLVVVGPVSVVARGADSAVADPKAELSRIISAMDEWAKSIAAIRLRFDVRTPSESSEWKEFCKTVDWCLNDASQIRYYKITTRDGDSLHRRLWILNRDRTYTAAYPKGPSEFERPERVSIAPARSPHDGIEPLWGVWVNGRCQWLPDVLAAATVVGSKEALTAPTDVKYPRLLVDLSDAVAPVLMLNTGFSNSDTFVLDVDHDLLPNRVLMGIDVENSALSRFECDTTEFRKLECGIWFPWAGTFTIHYGDGYSGKSPAIVSKWRVSSITVNEPADSKLFEPPMAIGTFVTDVFRQKTYYHGQDSARPEIEADRVRKAQDNLPPRAPVQAQRPVEPWLKWSVGFAGLAIILLGVAYLLRPR